MLLIGNGKLVTRDDAMPFLENGCVCIDGDTIKEVGATDALKAKYADAEFIDAKGQVIMPGLINTHEHIYSAMARGLCINGNNPQNFLEVLDGTWWTIDRNLSLEDTKYSAYTTLIEGIRNGVTTVFDHHASFGAIKDSLFTIADVSRELGIRSCLCYETSDRDGKEKLDEAIAENVEFIKYTNKENNDMIKAMFGMHAPFTCSNDTLERCAGHAKELGVGFHIHVAEGFDDLKHSLLHHGQRLVNRLLDYNILGEKTIAVHCIYVDEREMDILKDTNTMLVHNPESNMGNAVGTSPVLKFMEKGLLVGLGTDGYTHDVIESYKVANCMQKLNALNPSVAWGEIPQMLFYNNREIANRYFEKPLGILKAGAAADVIIADYLPRTPMTKDNVNSHILFGMNGKCVNTTVIAGNVVMKDRELVNIDEEAIYAKSRETANALWNRING
ncbi:MAG: putative aminohydrolase SsnA [Oscillospiraceae bacterium]